ncbi:DUF1000-domain-containing protein [Dacryopinax primogenitus]|uniref:DUF1000-domain-containing protein n=1 Tax=Dacryopinax primogenitus (strain DJM 731) TaxID=1858805 RepID=M5FXI1_DACPD|nr:DUF1000-domain-containing protein [Dacryopinax primogenitus]EJT98186.1 DUF1000-domain-containing protein [Dacryopinax primogenitus]
MSHSHSHGRHGHGHGHGHHHADGHGHDGHNHSEADKPLSSTPNSLHAQIDIPNVMVLNASDSEGAGAGREVLKPHAEREDERVYVQSDADDQLIFRIPFTANVKLRSLMLKTGPGEQTAEKVLLFPNEDNLDFSDVAERTPAQELECPQAREAVEYPLKAAKFSSCRSITLFVPASVGGETTRVYYIGFYGEWQPLQDKPVIAVYESKPQVADHPKVPGTDMGMNWGSH